MPPDLNDLDWDILKAAGDEKHTAVYVDDTKATISIGKLFRLKLIRHGLKGDLKPTILGKAILAKKGTPNG